MIVIAHESCIRKRLKSFMRLIDLVALNAHVRWIDASLFACIRNTSPWPHLRLCVTAGMVISLKGQYWAMDKAVSPKNLFWQEWCLSDVWENLIMLPCETVKFYTKWVSRLFPACMDGSDRKACFVTMSPLSGFSQNILIIEKDFLLMVCKRILEFGLIKCWIFGRRWCSKVSANFGRMWLSK